MEQRVSPSALRCIWFFPSWFGAKHKQLQIAQTFPRRDKRFSRRSEQPG